VAVGYVALSANTTGSANIGVGGFSLTANTTGSNNVAVGYGAGDAVTTGGDNVCIGIDAGQNITTGSRNICIGKNPQTGAVGSLDRIVMGYDVVGGADDSFLIGRGTIDSQIAFGATVITAPSDVRLKEEITDEKVGLDFIKALRPVTYRWKKAKDVPPELRAHADSEERVMNGKYNHGFIAQEVKALIDQTPDLKDGFDMWTQDDTDGRQRVGEAALIPIMVKAIQQLSAQVEELKAKLGE